MLGHITVNIDPFLIHFPKSWGIEGIRWYGVCYIFSFVIVQFFLAFYSKWKLYHLTPSQNDSLLFYFAFCSIVGGRLGYCLLYNIDNFIANPFIFFQVWRGGMASHGGFVGGIFAILYFSKKFHCDAFRVADIICSIIPICLMIGRIGNFLNAELVGRVTDVPWGIILAGNNEFGILPRHPSPIYEAMCEGLFPFIILQILIQRKNFYPGHLSGIFLILYSIARIVCEFFREPDAGLILGMTRGQFLSLFLFAFGILLILFRRKRQIKVL